MKKIRSLIIIGALLSALVIFSTSCTRGVSVKLNGEVASLSNQLVSLDFNLATGTYNITKLKDHAIPIRDAVLKINHWSSGAETTGLPGRNKRLRMSWAKEWPSP
jgi:hypothetical protein